MQITHAPPWMVLDLGTPHRVLSWALHRPGAVEARRIAWREVRDADLTEDLDARAWLAAEMAGAGLADAVGLVTSRRLAARDLAEATADGVTARCLATVGLSNAERVGARRTPAKFPGTINMVVGVNRPLTPGAALEALSVAVEARTLAVVEARIFLPSGWATGTGTDCAVLASPVPADVTAPVRGEDELPHAGLHTGVGEAVGAAVLGAVRRGIARWLMERAGR